MIDFHYSDTWADPGQQTVPSAWESHSLSQLVTDVYQHTYGILNYLKSNGISVTWVQVGNEINGGMLWPNGKTTNFANLASLINSGYKASKAVYPNAPVILHLANGYKTADFKRFFDGVKKANASWDVIGISHYPTSANWKTLNAQAATTQLIRNVI
uniref:arabinogalactan endo-beta-1,4-galactanase n=1 Tax=Globodera pallida TaxID=36090 RepID=A0A183BLE5_GLOPA